MTLTLNAHVLRYNIIFWTVPANNTAAINVRYGASLAHVELLAMFACLLPINARHWCIIVGAVVRMSSASAGTVTSQVHVHHPSNHNQFYHRVRPSVRRNALQSSTSVRSNLSMNSLDNQHYASYQLCAPWYHRKLRLTYPISANISANLQPWLVGRCRFVRCMAMSSKNECHQSVIELIASTKWLVIQRYCQAKCVSTSAARSTCIWYRIILG